MEIEYCVGDKVKLTRSNIKPIPDTDFEVVGFHLNPAKKDVDVLIYNVYNGHEGDYHSLENENRVTITIDRIKYPNIRGFWWVHQCDLIPIESPKKLTVGKIKSIIKNGNYSAINKNENYE